MKRLLLITLILSSLPAQAQFQRSEILIGGGYDSTDPVDNGMGATIDTDGNITTNGNIYLDGNLSIEGAFDTYLSIPDGTALEPSLRFTSDPDTGIWRRDVGIFGITTSGNEALNVNSNGSLHELSVGPISSGLSIRDTDGHGFSITDNGLSGVQIRTLTTPYRFIFGAPSLNPIRVQIGDNGDQGTLRIEGQSGLSTLGGNLELENGINSQGNIDEWHIEPLDFLQIGSDVDADIYTFDYSGVFSINGPTASSIILTEEDAGLNEKKWQLIGSNDSLIIQTLSDDLLTTQQQAYSINRTAENITSQIFYTEDSNANLTLTGDVGSILGVFSEELEVGTPFDSTTSVFRADGEAHIVDALDISDDDSANHARIEHSHGVSDDLRQATIQVTNGSATDIDVIEARANAKTILHGFVGVNDAWSGDTPEYAFMVGNGTIADTDYLSGVDEEATFWVNSPGRMATVYIQNNNALGKARWNFVDGTGPANEQVFQIESGDGFTDINARDQSGGGTSVTHTFLQADHGDGSIIFNETGGGSSTFDEEVYIDLFLEVSGEIRGANGTTSDPSFTFINDLDTGWSRGTVADNLYLMTGGTQGLHIDNTQKVWIPNGQLELTENNATITLNSASGALSMWNASGDLQINQDVDIFATGVLNLGEDNAVRGSLTMGSEVLTNGSIITLYNASDEDTDSEYWTIEADDVFRISDDATSLLTLNYQGFLGVPRVETTALDVTGTVNLDGSLEFDTAGIHIDQSSQYLTFDGNGAEAFIVVDGPAIGTDAIISSDGIFTGYDFAAGGSIGTTNSIGFLKTSMSAGVGAVSGGDTAFRFTSVASPNFLSVTGVASGSSPILSADGGDTDIDILIQAKGVGDVNVSTGTRAVLGLGESHLVDGDLVIYGDDDENGPQIWLYNAANEDDDIVDSFRIEADGNYLEIYDNSNINNFRFNTGGLLDALDGGFRAGTDETTTGTLYVYGDNGSVGPDVRFYNSFLENSPVEYYKLEPQDEWLALYTDGDTDLWRFYEAEGEFRALAGRITAGTNDVHQGVVTLHGGAGANTGGILDIRTSEDDSPGGTPGGTEDYFRFRAHEEYLEFGSNNTDSSAIRFYKDGGIEADEDIRVTGTNSTAGYLRGGQNDNTEGFLVLYGDSSVTGPQIHIYNAADEDTDDNVSYAEYYTFNINADKLNLGTIGGGGYTGVSTNAWQFFGSNGDFAVNSGQVLTPQANDAADPSYSFVNNTDSGMFLVDGTGDLAFSVDGTELLTVSPSGNDDRTTIITDYLRVNEEGTTAGIIYTTDNQIESDPSTIDGTIEAVEFSIRPTGGTMATNRNHQIRANVGNTANSNSIFFDIEDDSSITREAARFGADNATASVWAEFYGDVDIDGDLTVGDGVGDQSIILDPADTTGTAIINTSGLSPLVIQQDGTELIRFNTADTIVVSSNATMNVDAVTTFDATLSMINVDFIADNGTSTDPSITFEGQTTTGFSAQSDAIEFITSGSNRGSVNSGGKFDWEGSADFLGAVVLSDELTVSEQSRYADIDALTVSTGTLTQNATNDPMASYTLNATDGNINYEITGEANNANAQIVITQDGSVDYTITWPSDIKWAGNTEPNLAGANTIHVISFICYDGTNWAGTFLEDIQ